MLVSVIVPVFNAERYLARCLHSISEQTYKELEIILIDDGSTDSSGKLCDEFAKLDTRARVIHKTNGGPSSARNSGMELAGGEYITFVDSDDYLAKDFIAFSLALCKDYDAEISILEMAYVEENTNEEIRSETRKRVVKLTSEEAIKESLYQKLFSCCAPGKLYRKTVLDRIQFPLHALSEDLAVCHQILNNARTIVFSNRIGYYYRQQENSIMHVFNPKRLDALEWTSDIEDFCAKNYPALNSAAKCRAFNVAIHLALDLPDTKGENKEYYEKIWREVVRTRRSVLINPECRFREKAASLLSFFGIDLLKRIWNSRFAVKSNGN